MKIRDKIGTELSKFLYPYLINKGGYDMPKKMLDYESYTLQERYLWFLGCEELLADFYQTQQTDISVIDTRRSFYYANVKPNVRVLHSGLPSLVSYGKANLLTSGDVFQEVLKGDNVDEVTTELLQEILDDNKIDNLISDGAVTESWAERFAWKIVIDEEVSEFPIIEKCSPFNYEAIYKYGRLQEMVFKKTIEDYCLYEHYGKGYINYKLKKVTKTGEVEVPLTELEETAGLNDITFKAKIILASEKKVTKSDYKGIVAEFDALDEAWSQLMDEIRMARTETYIPDILMEGKRFDEFRKRYVTVGTDIREKGKNEIKHNQPDIRSLEYTNSILAIRSNILANVGLNQLTVGIDDEVGANASAISMEKRETVSLRTRKQMIKEWKSFLEEFYNKLMYAYKFNTSKAMIDYDINVTFGEYVAPSREALIENAKKMFDADIIDREKALEEIYGEELSEEEKQRILTNNKVVTPGGIDFFGE